VPTIDFVEEAPAGLENRILPLVIPETGTLPQTPFDWDERPVTSSTLEHRSWRTWGGGRRYSTVLAGSATLLWVEERSQWVAFQEQRDRRPTGGFYYDETLVLLGPWQLGPSFLRALVAAFPGAGAVPLVLLEKPAPEVLAALPPCNDPLEQAAHLIAAFRSAGWSQYKVFDEVLATAASARTLPSMVALATHADAPRAIRYRAVRGIEAVLTREARSVEESTLRAIAQLRVAGEVHEYAAYLEVMSAVPWEIDCSGPAQLATAELHRRSRDAAR